MPRSDAKPQVSARRAVDEAFLPHAFHGRPGADPLRAYSFWATRPRHDDLAALRERARADISAVEDSAEREMLRAERIAELARLSPELIRLADDARPAVRATVALCYSILAKGGQAPADRQVWRMLLGLARYDIDGEVRAAAEAALADFERYGTVARAS
ncbi:hypothetical protein [Demequina sp.]|uniref:hypothetical protein n=1 Tax=Demequina sp. TaxID=2050685 RepID=UPI0025EFAB7F|nr:hypothetical protein [Demequina sp.]